jgi:S-adenosylmethionine decarboxylase proenzyme
MTDVATLTRLCRNACASAGLTPVAEAFHQFRNSDGSNGGVTGAIILAESHLAIHTWPELNALTLDLYVCNFSQDNHQAANTAFDSLMQAFEPQRVERRDIARGLVAPVSPS